MESLSSSLLFTQPGPGSTTRVPPVAPVHSEPVPAPGTEQATTNGMQSQTPGSSPQVGYERMEKELYEELESQGHAA